MNEEQQNFLLSNELSFRRLDTIEMVNEESIPQPNTTTTTTTITTKEPTGEKFSTKTTTILNLIKQEIHIQLVGPNSRTTTYLHFLNTTTKTIQGELRFPLNPGSTLESYGLDIDGIIVDAVPVSKDAARVAFEEIHPEKGQVSIAEKVDEFSNIFKTRVYPMNPGKERIVKIVVLDKLQSDMKKKNLYYWNSLCHQKKTMKKGIKVVYESDVGKGGKVFLKKKNKDELVKVERDGKKKMEMEIDDEEVEGIVIKVPMDQKQMISTEKDPNSGVYYFSATVVLPEEKEGKKKEMIKEKKVKKISVFYDCSTSRSRFSNIKEEIELILDLFSQFKEPTIEMITFSNEILEKREFKKKKDIQKYLNEIIYDGGTNIPVEEFSSIDSDMIFLFSDGLHTYGEHIDNKIKKCGFKKPIFTFSSSTKTSFLMLKYLSKISDGKHIDLLKTKKSDVYNMINKDIKKIRKIEFKKSEIDEVYHTTIENGCVNVYGQINVDKAEFILHYDDQKIPVKINTKEMLLKKDSTLIGTLWASQKIMELSIFSRKNKKEIEEIGIKFGLVTEHSSLIVLETLDMYLRYKIPPPLSRNKMRKEYFNTILDEEKKEEKREKEKLENVVRKWNTKRVEWHKKDFKPEVIKKGYINKGIDNIDAAYINNFDATRDGRDNRNRRRRMSPLRDRARSRSRSRSPIRNNDNNNNNNQPRRRRERRTSICFISNESRPIQQDLSTPESPQVNSPDKVGIKVKAWQGSKEPYMKTIKESKSHYKAYLEEKKKYIDIPSFYLDVADFFLVTTKNMKIGLKVLSNIPELELNNHQLLRIIGYRLDQAEYYDEAQRIFEKVKLLRAEEPQSYRDLALVVEKKNQLKRAAELLYKVITGKWDSRFDEIEMTACVELNHVLQKMKKQEMDEMLKVIDKRLVYKIDVDIRISMSWDTDKTDIDLHVYDPDNEHCFYSHNKTKAGGFLSRDFTQGYGPEEFMQKKVYRSGRFRITAKYYASHQTGLTGGTTILCSMFENYMRKNEKCKLVTLRLATNKEEIEVCTMNFKK